jgi:zinc protease
MEIIDRTKQPQIKSFKKAVLLKPAKYKLDNEIPVFAFNAGTQDVVKIQFAFRAGSWFQSEVLTAFTTNKLIIEGSKKHKAAELASQIDFYGAYIELKAEKDMAYVSLYTQNKHLKNTLPILEEIIRQPVFPENELKTFLQNQKQDYMIDCNKVNFIARSKFNELIFGKDHPYGRNAEVEDFDKVKTANLLAFHKKFYTAENCTVIISGRVNHETINGLNCYFGDDRWMQKKEIKIPQYKISTSKTRENLIVKEKVSQSSLRIGKILFNKTHPDFHGLQVLNTLLGGYFGSRLMTNIREDKGFTYGIGSAVVSLNHAGFFFITSEVGVDVCNRAIEEIYHEIKKLRTEKISKNELDLVRSYMTGNFLRSIDGPFAIADRFLGIYEYGLSYDYYDKLINTIKTITPAQLAELAEKHLREDSMIELVVGNKN